MVALVARFVFRFLFAEFCARNPAFSSIVIISSLIINSAENWLIAFLSDHELCDITYLLKTKDDSAPQSREIL